MFSEVRKCHLLTNVFQIFSEPNGFIDYTLKRNVATWILAYTKHESQTEEADYKLAFDYKF